jgi:TrmH family RNA methyltransferase
LVFRLMPVRIVQSKQNARLKELRRVLALPGREGHGLAGIEGPNLIDEALKAGLRLTCVFAAQGFEHLVEPLPIPAETEILLMKRELLDSALATQSPQPVAALVELPDWTWAHLLPRSDSSVPLIAVLAGIQDPGNLGAIIRSAEAFGADGLVALPGTVSPWNPKSIRASAGSVFRLPIVAASVAECFTNLRESGIRILTTTVRAAQPVDLVDLTVPVAIIFGNEGNGVPEPVAVHADEPVTISCPGAVESLNAAVAASVALYEASRQRREQEVKLLGRKGAKR